jgi:hypothetical protein
VHSAPAERLETVALRDWAEGIAGRRGRAIAAVALARRLAGILFAMWRDGTVYDATKVRGPVTARRAALDCPRGQGDRWLSCEARGMGGEREPVLWLMLRTVTQMAPPPDRITIMRRRVATRH